VGPLYPSLAIAHRPFPLAQPSLAPPAGFMGLPRASTAGLSSLAVNALSVTCRYFTMGCGISGFDSFRVFSSSCSCFNVPPKRFVQASGVIFHSHIHHGCVVPIHEVPKWTLQCVPIPFPSSCSTKTPLSTPLVLFSKSCLLLRHSPYPRSVRVGILGCANHQFSPTSRNELDKPCCSYRLKREISWSHAPKPYPQPSFLKLLEWCLLDPMPQLVSSQHPQSSTPVDYRPTLLL